MLTKKSPKISMKFYCKCCDYGTGKPSEYNKHLLTAKHEILTNTPEEISTAVKLFKCECGKRYKHRQSLNNHKKRCDYVSDVVDKSIEEGETAISLGDGNDVNYKELIMTLIKENSKLVATISEIAPKIGNNNNNIKQKNNFNINIFLNEQCKDAISMDNFIKGIEVSMKNLLTTKDKGLAEGVSNIFIENMSKLSLHERPLHCTDTKRETLYIKNEEWEKDKDNKQIKEQMRAIAQKQVKSLNKWTEEHPNYLKVPHLQDEYTKLIQGITDTLDQNEDKVLKNVCNNVYVPETDETMAIK
jgi:hypothetical protein